jgi:hypothetical protein
MNKHSSHRRPHSHPEPRWRQLLWTYRFELAWLLVVCLGVFLVFERMNIRRTLFGWINRALDALAQGGGRFLQWAVRAFETATLSDVIGVALLFGALVALAFRVRWRLMHNPKWTTIQCPMCSAEVHRVHRHQLDHLANILVPTRRYRCTNHDCRWEGIRIMGPQQARRR